jgi:ATP-dependent Clp protease ATP-binding subunit ClpA
VSGLEIYNQRFADSGRQVFARALNGARLRGRNYVVVAHFIEALNAEEGRLFQLLTDLLKIDLDRVQTMMEEKQENFPPQANASLRLAPTTIALLKQAWELAHKDHRLQIESFDLIWALLAHGIQVLSLSLDEKKTARIVKFGSGTSTKIRKKAVRIYRLEPRIAVPLWDVHFYVDSLLRRGSL